MIRVGRVRRDSIAEELQIEAGTTLLRINGSDLRDGLDLAFLQAEAVLEVEAETPDGRRLVYDIEKGPDEPLGVEPEPDKIRRCTNACPFCFVKGNPKANKLRTSLYIKDDDYRLSFLHGHYVTLTNLREEDWLRIFEQHLSPLYVSVHATDPDVRLEMMKNPRSAEIDRHLDRLQSGGIEFHAQVVLCPELNDGPVLDTTIEELYARGEGVRSLSIVPVGLTAFNADRGIRPLTSSECEAALRQVDEARSRALRERGYGWCYAADELFLQAGAELPGSDYFDDPELVGNGVGAISHLADRVRADLGRLPRLSGKRVALVTGTSMSPYLRELAREIGEASGANVDVVERHNTLYGPTVTSAGLLPGRDHAEALTGYEDHDLALFSAAAVNEGDLFLDDLSLAELNDLYPRLDIWPSRTITDVLAEV